MDVRTQQAQGPTPAGTRGPGRRPGPAALAADVVAVVVFVALGRRSHEHGESLGGLATTAWPFLTGTAAGWLALLATRRQPTAAASGAVVVAATVVVGMALRAVSGQGTAASFVVVTTVVLAAFLLGWRGAYAALRSRRARA